MTKHLTEDDAFHLYYLLRTNKLVAKIWPVYSWDQDDPVYGLMVDDDHAYALLSEIAGVPFTKQQLKTVLERYGVEPFGSLFGMLPEEKLLADFYRKRKDRRILA